jgi:hypothetical protein
MKSDTAVLLCKRLADIAPDVLARFDDGQTVHTLCSVCGEPVAHRPNPMKPRPVCSHCWDAEAPGSGNDARPAVFMSSKDARVLVELGLLKPPP